MRRMIVAPRMAFISAMLLVSTRASAAAMPSLPPVEVIVPEGVAPQCVPPFACAIVGTGETIVTFVVTAAGGNGSVSKSAPPGASVDTVWVSVITTSGHSYRKVLLNGMDFTYNYAPNLAWNVFQDQPMANHAWNVTIYPGSDVSDPPPSNIRYDVTVHINWKVVQADPPKPSPYLRCKFFEQGKGHFVATTKGHASSVVISCFPENGFDSAYTVVAEVSRSGLSPTVMQKWDRAGIVTITLVLDTNQVLPNGQPWGVVGDQTIRTYARVGGTNYEYDQWTWRVYPDVDPWLPAVLGLLQ
jgi:hypothetical protein